MSRESFVNIPNTAIDAASPVVEEVMFGLRDNTISVATMDLSAPVNEAAWHSHDGTTGNGRIWSHGVNGSVASITTPGNFDLDRYEYKVVGIGLRCSQSLDCGIDVLREGEGTFNNGVASYDGDALIHEFAFDVRQNGKPRNFIQLIGQGFRQPASGNVGVPISINGALFNATNTRCIRVRLNASGVFERGELFLLRRGMYLR